MIISNIFIVVNTMTCGLLSDRLIKWERVTKATLVRRCWSYWTRIRTAVSSTIISMYLLISVGPCLCAQLTMKVTRFYFDCCYRVVIMF